MIRVTVTGQPVAKGRPGRQKATDDELLSAYAELSSVRKVAERFGMCGQSVHERLQKLGAARPQNIFTPAERVFLEEHYESYAAVGQLYELAERMGRTKQFICRQARDLGLTNQRRSKPYADGAPLVAWRETNGHARGMLGKKHSAATRARLAKTSAAHWRSLTEEQQADQIMRARKTRVAVHGSGARQIERGTWKAGWREIGGKRKFYRSRWEANYARYLEWLKARGEIAEWSHEPETFWFEKIKRGVRSYLPDFRVVENSGAVVFHEVKGWMDDRSRVCLKRMAKYHPKVKLLLIDAKQYRAIAAQVGPVIEGWE